MNLYTRKIPSLSYQKQYFIRAVNRKPYGFTLLQIIAMTLRLAYGADQSSVKQRRA